MIFVNVHKIFSRIFLVAKTQIKQEPLGKVVPHEKCGACGIHHLVISRAV
jgi:hypothetical protein